MKVGELAGALGLKTVIAADTEKEIKGVYACDLLSRVMSECAAGDAWITVLTHPNMVSVGELNDAACIIVADDVVIRSSVIEAAADKNVNILSSSMSAYELCWKMHDLLG